MKSALMAACALGALAVGVPAATAEPAMPPQPNYGVWGFDSSGMDPRVNPGDDFFGSVNGAWVAHTDIPADETSFGAFDMLADLSEAREHLLLEAAAAKGGPATTPEGRIGAAYKAFMDEVTIEQKGTAPLAPILDAIHGAQDRSALAALMGRPGYSAVFDLSIEADLKNPNVYQVYLSQGGLGLPDRDYYLTADLAAKKAAYQAYVAKLLGLIGWAEADKRAAEVVAFETDIAKASWTRAEQRDPVKTYNPTTVAALEKAAPGFAFGRMLAAADLGGRSAVVVQTNTAMPKIAALYAAAPLDTLKAWEAFHTVDSVAGVLPKAFVDAHFAFSGKTLSGQAEIAPRWKRGVRMVDSEVGEALGQVYVAQYFPPESKAKMEVLIAGLKAAFAKRIQGLDWMGPKTKQQALAKLANFDVQIGYPKRWRDYTKLEIRADDAFGNAWRAGAFDWARRVDRLNAPVDKDEWQMTPQTIDAYNMPMFNEVVFPAAILQPPFFNPKADPAINYGAIGGVIGHEMTHGFDDEGRQFDPHGRLRDWWTAQDAARFKAKAARLGAQYSAMEPLPGVHIKGDLTMGENIADLGGLTLGLEAYHASLGGKPSPMIEGLTGDQRVFLGWAQVWREKQREDALRRQLASNEHSPPVARVNAVVRNIDAWYAAFGVKPTDKLYIPPAQRVRIW